MNRLTIVTREVIIIMSATLLAWFLSYPLFEVSRGTSVLIPMATFLLFSNGKLVCTGTKNKQQLEDSMVQLNRNIKEAIKDVK